MEVPDVELALMRERIGGEIRPTKVPRNFCSERTLLGLLRLPLPRMHDRSKQEIAQLYAWRSLRVTLLKAFNDCSFAL